MNYEELIGEYEKKLAQLLKVNQQAKLAVAYAINRCRTDGEFHEHMDGTATLGFLLEADAALNGREYDRTKIPFINCESERPVRCRHDHELVELYREVIQGLDEKVNREIEGLLKAREDRVEGGLFL